MSTSVAFKQKSLFRAVPGLFSQRRLFNPATPFDNASVAQQTLEAILDSLGGILWLPNQHNYTLTTDTAVAESGDPVGYIGSHRQNLPENYIKNSMMVGASAGVLATYWQADTTAINGVTFAHTGTGTDSDGVYQEWTASGTAGGTSAAFPVRPNGLASGTNNAPAAVNQLWSLQAKIKQTAGTAKTFYAQMSPHNGTTAGTSIFSSNISCVVGSATYVSVTGVLASAASVDRVLSIIALRVLSGSGDWTGDVFRIYAPQLERGKPTAFTPTYGTALTRGTNFAPAWQDTTAYKPILGVDADGKSIITYNGTTNFFRTGIQTPEAGYIAGVWQTNSTGISKDMFGSSNTTTVVGAVLRKNPTEQVVMQRNDGTLSASAAVNTFGSNKRVVDASYSFTEAFVRLDGANEGTTALDRTVTSTNYFRIGATGTATADNQANFWDGKMLAQVWIPGARPGATAEAEIRRLLAELTAVSGVV